MDKKDKIRVIVLAAGSGTRMKSEQPKVLTKVRDKTMIEHLLLTVAKSGIDDRPIIVVGYKKEEVIKKLGGKYEYVVQERQLGTGHAVLVAQSALENKAENVIVLYGDHPFISPVTIKKLAEKHLTSGEKITMVTVKLPDFNDWRSIFYTNFSRIIRDNNGNIIKDVQFKDASDEEKKATEVNPCYFCFETTWLWSKLKTLNKNNAQKEYYLTDLIKIAMQEGTKIQSIQIEPKEALGINSKEELGILERLIVQ